MNKMVFLCLIATKYLYSVKINIIVFVNNFYCFNNILTVNSAHRIFSFMSFKQFFFFRVSFAWHLYFCWNFLFWFSSSYYPSCCNKVDMGSSLDDGSCKPCKVKGHLCDGCVEQPVRPCLCDRMWCIWLPQCEWRTHSHHSTSCHTSIDTSGKNTQ